MIYKGPGISTYWGDNEYSARRAEVMHDEEAGFYVDMYFDSELVETRPLYKHSESYAEDVAKNWCLGYMP